MTIAELDELNAVGLNEADKTKLVDIQTIKIDHAQSALQRMENYLKQIKNPYLFLCDDTAIKINFNPSGNDLKYKLKRYYTNIKNN